MKFPKILKISFNNLKKKPKVSKSIKKIKEAMVILEWIGLKKHLGKDNLGDFLQEYIKDFRTQKTKKNVDSKEPFVYCALGDSTVEGMGSSSSSNTYPALVFSALQQTNPQSSYHNFGQIGATSKDIIELQLTKTIELNPKLVTISIGANDVMRGTSRKDFTENLDLILNELTKKTKATIIINNIPDFSTTSFVPAVLKYYCQVRSKMINNVIKEQSDKFNIVFIDLHLQSKIFKDYPGLVSNDGLHPSDLGYALWATTIISQIYQILFPKREIALAY